jgi:CRP/FNR family transcriptional regulator
MNGIERNKNCHTGELRGSGFFSHLSPEALEEFDAIKYSTNYPARSVLFLENEEPRGVFVLCSGRIKLSVSSSCGKTLILRIAKPGDILGLTSSMSDCPYEATAETLQPSQIAYIRKDDFSRFIKKHPEVYQVVIKQLSSHYSNACEQLRTIGLSASAHEKLARLLLHWSSDGAETKEGAHIKLPLTHEQIAECVGSTRETVTRTLSEFKNRHLVTFKGATLFIPNRAALEAVSGN